MGALDDIITFEDPGYGSDFKVREWFKDKKFVLGTVQNVHEIMDVCIASDRFALDVETTGFDNRVVEAGGLPLHTVDRISGVCLSPDGIRGYYIPIGHVKTRADGTRVPLDCNVPMEVFDPEFCRLMKAMDEGKTAAVFHNAKFDQEFLEFNGTGHSWGDWDKLKNWHDTYVLAYLRNTRERNKGLKFLSNQELGIDQVELDELYPPDHKGKKDFSMLDPTEKETLWYACGDAICTWLLFDKVSPPVLQPDTDGQTQNGIYGIEKGCVGATRWMERNCIHIDRKKVGDLIVLGHREWYSSVLEVYAEATKILGRDVMPGVYRFLKDKFVFDEPSNSIQMQKKSAVHPAENQFPDPAKKVVKRIKGEDGAERDKEFPPVYDVDNPQELGPMFEEMGIKGLKYTEKSGQVKTSRDELDKILEDQSDEYPFIGKVARFREVNKALSTFLYSMYTGSDPNDDTMRIAFQGHKVDTGRFATPSKDSDRGRIIGWPQVNIQSIPSYGDPDRPECMRRLRECISVRPNPVGKPPRFLVAVDYAGVELRLVTNLSLEPKWLEEFFRCSGCGRPFERGNGAETPEPPPPRCPNCGSDKIGDLHTLTALAIYGPDAPEKENWKVLRGQAKGTNFALCYGGGGHAVCVATGVDRNEGDRIKRQFDGAYTGLKRWWADIREFARKHEFVRTGFGRKYPVEDINSQDHSFKAKAERNAVNGPIQGSSADVTKTAMFLIYKELKKRGWLRKVMMTITMHDELVFEMDADVMEEAISVIIPVMTRNALVLGRKWPIPLTCDVEIGLDWSVPWDLNAMRHGEIRFAGDKKIKDKKKVPEGMTWDSLGSWPESLKPWFKAATGKIPPPPREEPPPQGRTDPPPERTSPPPMTDALPGLPKENPPSSSAPAPVVLRQEFPDLPSELPMGAPYEYVLTAPLTLMTLDRLALIISQFRGKGTNPLTIIKDGIPLTELIIHHPFDGEPIRVNPTVFHVAAQIQGL